MKHKLNNPSQACFMTEMAEKIYGVDPLDTTRARTNVYARSAISVVMVEAGENYYSIAEFFKKDHSSIMYGVKKHPENMKFDRSYRQQFEDFLKEIKRPANQEEYTLAEIKGQVVGINKKLAGLNYDVERISEFWNEVILESREKQSA